MNSASLAAPDVSGSRLMGLATTSRGPEAMGDRYASDDARWAAITTRDARADDAFFYSVATTGVYCRPSCASRGARRENVAFHATAEEAERQGFRACKRCRPREAPLEARRAALVTEACRLLEAGDAPPDLETLARSFGLSRYHFHRLFKKVTGLTPRAYAEAQRAKNVRRALDESPSVGAAIYDAGYQSSGRFYAAAPALLGMTPTAFRDGGRGLTIRYAVRPCSLGAVLVAATPRGVCAIELGDDPTALDASLNARFTKATRVPGDALFNAWVDAVVSFVESPTAALALPLDVRGTAFQHRVWQALREVPLGTTLSYGELARRIGAPGSARAVARACATNQVGLAIPCHRVVRGDGGLSGYRWGESRKRALIEREAQAASAPRSPPPGPRAV